MRLQNVFRDAAIRDISLGIDREDPSLVKVLEQISHAQDDHLVGDDQDALSAVMQAYGVEHASQPEDDIAAAKLLQQSAGETERRVI